MPRKILIICVDGLGPEYLQASPTPNMDRMSRAGSFAIGESVIPSVTNVNNVSIVTGVPPSVHGITSNYMVDMATGAETYMESAEHLCYPTVLTRAKGAGLSTAVLTAKKKLLRLLGIGVDYALSAEEPDATIVESIGPAPDIYSPDVNLWLFRALGIVLRDRDPDLVYCATTDGMMHKYPPEAPESLEHVHGLDRILGDIVADNSDREVYVTADHGMSHKTWGVDLERALAAHAITARAIPIIKDRYVVHHGNLGGASYVYLQQTDLAVEAKSALVDVPGVEEVHLKVEAAATFDLMADRIGDLFVLADADTVFGEFPGAARRIRVPVDVRSHGSRHESAVPVLAYGGDPSVALRRNYDIVAGLQLGLRPVG